MIFLGNDFVDILDVINCLAYGIRCLVNVRWTFACRLAFKQDFRLSDYLHFLDNKNKWNVIEMRIVRIS